MLLTPIASAAGGRDLVGVVRPISRAAPVRQL
jgi:hypothetical protein